MTGLSPTELLEPLQYAFMQRALLVAVLAALVCGLLSCWLVLMGWSLMGDAVSHAVLPGVVLAYVVGAPFALGAVIFGAGAVGLIGVVRGRGRIRDDAAIGVVFTSLFALGLVLVSVTPSQVDLGHIVFGNLLGVSTADVVQVLVVAAVVTAALLVKRRDLTLLAFDPTHAHAIGLSPRRLEVLLLGALALTSVVALQAVGVVLVVALLVIPGATARLLTERFGRMLVIAPGLAVACALVGVWSSYLLDTASGPSIVVALGICFTMAFLVAPRHGVVPQAWRRRRDGRTRRPAAVSG
ncbi:metal ABC transporter permease [Litorihabitans aurantiacus]|uniref:Membrane protein n=1 Tax=Litorihabitans aurantiacus TaxID=1930061 RepID=A0AA38CVE8_9MICO|nr:metal ABC transporter permease [Litorihabitans aurantiacus]GMA32845.1 membrane protein [Litorihabitans aurantiacus]